MPELDNLLQQTADHADNLSQQMGMKTAIRKRLYSPEIHKQRIHHWIFRPFFRRKSSMNNALSGQDLLPSSATRQVQHGEGARNRNRLATIHMTDGTGVKYGGHGFPAAVKSFRKDGAAVSLVEIGHTESNLPEGITVMDTPGVDSTDDAHRFSTESALHLRGSSLLYDGLQSCTIGIEFPFHEGINALQR